MRFAEHGGRPSCRTATVEADGEALASLTYGQAATLWRINLGENRRQNRDQYGFVLDLERGYWQRSEQAGDDEDERRSADAPHQPGSSPSSRIAATACSWSRARPSPRGRSPRSRPP